MRPLTEYWKLSFSNLKSIDQFSTKFVFENKRQIENRYSINTSRKRIQLTTEQKRRGKDSTNALATKNPFKKNLMPFIICQKPTPGFRIDSHFLVSFKCHTARAFIIFYFCMESAVIRLNSCGNHSI